MIKKGFRGPPRAGEGEKSTVNPLSGPNINEPEGVAKYWSPYFSPLSNIYNVPTEEPTAAERLAILHLFFFAADFVAVKTGAEYRAGFSLVILRCSPDAVKAKRVVAVTVRCFGGFWVRARLGDERIAVADWERNRNVARDDFVFSGVLSFATEAPSRL